MQGKANSERRKEGPGILKMDVVVPWLFMVQVRVAASCPAAHWGHLCLCVGLPMLASCFSCASSLGLYIPSKHNMSPSTPLVYH
jgi:hypothetical protein